MAIYKSINSQTALKTHGGLKNCLHYVLSPEKTSIENCYVIGPYEGSPDNADKIYEQFIMTKKQFNADSGRQYAHAVISFHKDEKITPEQALSFAIDFSEKSFDGRQVLISIHEDKKHTHCHLVINTVSYIDGKKLHKSKKDLEADKEICNDLCKKYDLTVAQKGKHFDGTDIEEGEILAWNKEKYRALIELKKESFLADCGIAVLNTVEQASSKDEFISRMKEKGWDVNWSDKNKHITFSRADGKKIRGKNLLKTFGINATKEGLSNEFERKRTLSERAGRTENYEPSENKRVGDRKQQSERPDNKSSAKSKGRRM